MNIEEWHEEEGLAKERIRKRSPNHPILKQIFISTHEAVEAYWDAESRL